MDFKKFEYERKVLEALLACSMVPGSYDKKFVRSVHNLLANDEDATLSPKQRVCVWRIGKKYRRQLGENRMREAGQNLVGLVEANWDALHEGVGIKGERGRFESQLSLEPDDWTTRLVYADWLEEHGESILSDGQRWQAANKKYPALMPSASYRLSYSTVERGYRHRWIMVDVSEVKEPCHLCPNVWSGTLESYGGGRIMAEQLLAARIKELGIGRA